MSDPDVWSNLDIDDDIAADNELDALRAENDALRAKWESVPRDAIHHTACDSAMHHDPARNATVVLAWLSANAPHPQGDDAQ